MEKTFFPKIQEVKTITRFMTKELLAEKPEKPIPFLIEWIGKNWGLTGYENNSVKEELSLLRKEYKLLLKRCEDNCSEDSESGSESLELEESVLNSAINLKNLPKRRFAISAESYGNFNESYKEKVKRRTKSSEKISFLSSKLKSISVLPDLGEAKFNVLASLMEKKTVKSVSNKSKPNSCVPRRVA